MPDQIIAANRKALATIILDSQASKQEEYAAGELLYYLERITGACFTVEKISSKASNLPKPALAVGQAALALGLEEPADLGPDGFILRTLADGLAIYGGKRGVIYGVYELLEQLGCRFFTPLSEKIPVIESLILPQIDSRQVPVLEYRYHNYKDFTGFPVFAVKQRINGPVPIPENQGGHMNYVWFVHTFESILDPEEYFAEHPEYFSEIDGKRLKHRTQLCLTNPDVLRITIKKVKQALSENPQCQLISVSQNDWYNACTCRECRSIDEAQGSQAGSLIWFINQVAEAVEPDFPDAIIDTLAYQYSRPAPRNLRPRHNVCVRLCSIESCFTHPFANCDDQSREVRRPDGSTSRFLTDLQDWAKVCDRLYIWDYTTCFAHYPMPFPNWNVLQPNMQDFIKNNVKGVFEQACGAAGGSTDLNELRAYLLSKLLWNANCDIEKHMQEFLDFYYGAAGSVIREYIQLLTDTVENENIHVGFNDSCDQPYLTEERLDQFDRLFDRACEQVSGDPIRLARVDKARLSLRWVRLKNQAMQGVTPDLQVVNQFFTDWKAHDLTRIDEWVSEKLTHKALLRQVWRGVEFLDNWWDEGREIR